MKFLERFWFGCAHCHDGHGCHVGEHLDPDTGEMITHVHGIPLTVLAVLVFIVPLLTAVSGAYLLDQWELDPSPLPAATTQIAGAVIGFFVGVSLARLVVWVCGRRAASQGDAE